MTSAAAPSSVTREARRVGSRLRGVSVDTPDAQSTTATSSPAGTSSTFARAPDTTTPADPDTRPSRTSTSPSSATAPTVEPSARPGSSRSCNAAGPAAAITALAITVGTNGPGATARPSRSTTTTSSGRPKPDPPYASGRCRPSQPSSAASGQNAGRASVSASSSARAAPRALCFTRKSATVSASARWSSVMAIDIGERTFLSWCASARQITWVRSAGPRRGGCTSR